jgi:hypothetical protein
MLNVFSGDAFSTVSLTRAFLATPYVPNLLGTLGIFDDAPITTDTAAMERLGNTLALVASTPRGAPPASRTHDKRTVRDVRTVRLALRDRIYAHEVANLRAFGQETALETMQGYAMRRMAKLRQDIELTWEHLRMGCIKGAVIDGDGSTTLYNWFTFWGVSEPAAIDFNLDDATTDVDGVCRTVMRTMEVNAEGGLLPTSTVYGFAGNAFFDALVSHPKVVQFYVNRPAADQYLANTKIRRLEFGGITFVNYRGTDDGTTVGVATDDCRFVIAGGRDIFQMVLSPRNESMDFMNTLGQPVYAMMVPDRDRAEWVDVEAYSYPLPVCLRPRTLLKGTRT